MILYPNLPIAGLAQQVMQAFVREKAIVRVEQEVEDVLTAVALVAGGFGICVTTASSASLRLPGVVYRPLKSSYLREIELSCLYRRADSLGCIVLDWDRRCWNWIDGCHNGTDESNPCCHC